MSRGRIIDTDDEDEEALTPPKRALDGELDLTSLIDVVFLLLIFFMVSSTMKGTPDVDTPQAHFGTGVVEKTSAIVTVLRAGPGGPPMIILGDGRGPEGNFDDVYDYVSLAAREGKTHVIIKAERDIPHGFVQKVAKAVSKVENIRLNIGVQEKH
jgi:biopolymer transport protein ExbD